MIKCNLAVLLAERNLKISELSKRTGISRTTLTALSQNQSKGIQFDTFDTLCSYLKISPNDLFIQEVFEYDFNVYYYYEKLHEIEMELKTEIEYKSEQITRIIPCAIKVYLANGNPNIVESISITPKYDEELINILKSIPVTFKTSFELEMAECIKSEIVIKLNLDYEDIETHIW